MAKLNCLRAQLETAASRGCQKTLAQRHLGSQAPFIRCGSAMLRTETEAEAVGFVVCRAIRFDTNNAAADYVALYAGDSATVAASLRFIPPLLPKLSPA
jgi:hypothetical protein